MMIILSNLKVKWIIGMFLCFLISFNVVSQSKKTELDLDQLFSQMDFNGTYYPEKAKHDLQSLKQHISEGDIYKYDGYLNYTDALLLFSDLEMDSSLVCIEKAMASFSVSENSKWLAKSQILLGQIAEVSGLYEQAKINFYEAISIGEKSSVDAGFAYIGVARCKRVLKEDYKEEFSLGIQILKDAEELEIQLFAEFMELLFDLSNQETPQKLNELASKYLDMKLYLRAASAYKVIASSYNAKGNLKDSHHYCDLAIDICEKHKIGDLIKPALYQFKGVLYFKQKLFDTAEVYFNRSLELYKSLNQEHRMLYSYSYLHKIDIAKNDYVKAYDDLNTYQQLLEETKSFEKIRMAKVLEINNKIDLIKSQLVKLKVEKKASEFMLYLVIVITIGILSAVGVYVYLYQKNKKAKIAELNKEFHNLLIGIGEKQLLEHRLSHDKKLLKKQKEEFSKINSTGDIVDSFDSCYMETINLFTDSFPQLTKTEVRYAVMLCLKLPMEVIAKVQNVQPASIRKAKQRIRTKLNVESNIEDYLQNYRERLISDMTK
ncbi:transcriptional regulator [Plebeiibacterium sediminum]|uniref:Tetratricopeptide repeat protein n=1 Tax=Plebeiibacterium sediminum TaxID=2992112 RepID=A0AAE3M418_9BACT|nr:tetratricopeptide repeat protein [Plebeiobacterium sediminum]MCW3786402.1 tetratricopeptide repeat protein [Plebeiobacterium sediminum]